MEDLPEGEVSDSDYEIDGMNQQAASYLKMVLAACFRFLDFKDKIF